MALLGSMVAVMVLLFSAIIFLHRRQHRANKETFLGFYGESSELGRGVFRWPANRELRRRLMEVLLFFF